MTVADPAQPRTAVPPAPALADDPPRRGRLADLINLVRPRQWSKNAVVVPLALLDAPDWSARAFTRIGWAVLVFTIAASLVYVVNDIADRHRDAEHPVKRHRPLASGRVGVGLAWAYAVLLGALLVGGLAVEPLTLGWPALAYVALNLAYSTWLKHLPMVDVFVIAGGFLLRLVIGDLAAGSHVSGWLTVSVLALCLLLILGKRRTEILASTTEHRPALRGYTVQLADYLILLSAGLTGVAFLLYLRTEAPIGGYATAAMLVSAPFALFCLFRYLQNLLIRHTGGDPAAALFGDRVLVTSSLLWMVPLVAIFAAARYPGFAHALLHGVI
ncbi:UbiA prenyltransferase family protein [Hamadaea tsunoensis]|uniref:UbiA prenyltransferase family protein n=1 Tax=Hamadaea tsunoensis TaxID=53368 RepID=UPI000428B5D0|nr:UbiA prenyltransferase family protein [Hamadaea tsunoensis]